MHRQLLVIFAAALSLTLIIAGCAPKEKKETKPEEKKTEEKVEKAPLPTLSTEAQKLPAGTKVAVIETDNGNIEIQLYTKEMPKTTENFIKLSDQGFYDGLKWHRVLAGQLIQAGDPTGVGNGGPGYSLEYEDSPFNHEQAGIIAMAKAKDVISGSQFYITLKPLPSLDPQKFEPFGKVVSGMDVAKKVIVGDIIKRIAVVEVGAK
jgi:peptidyl-prolyl cis-trans isomerase B (cyclophilin B)